MTSQARENRGKVVQNGKASKRVSGFSVIQVSGCKVFFNNQHQEFDMKILISFSAKPFPRIPTSEIELDSLKNRST